MVSSADPAVSRRDFATGETGRGPFIPTNRASNPRAGQWTNAMSHNMIADYKRFLMTDGEGIRCSLYVSGCPFHCEGCYNSSIWDFRAGHEYNDRLEAQIMADLSLPYVQGITFLGGEPLLNTGVPIDLPESSANPLEAGPDPMEIAIDASGQIYIDGVETGDGDLPGALEALAGTQTPQKPLNILLRGDTRINYGRMMLVMGELNRVGLNKISLVTTSSSDGE